MHHGLKHRIQAMRDKLEGRAPVAEIQGSSQLFVTPSPECRRLVELADVRETDRILEPSAGTGAIPGRSGMQFPGRSVTPWSCTPG